MSCEKRFSDHLQDYMNEVSDPAHRQEYLDYLDQYENFDYKIIAKIIDVQNAKLKKAKNYRRWI